MNELEAKLQHLRKLWTKYPEKRAAIELQAKVLQMQPHKEEEPLITRIRKALL